MTSTPASADGGMVKIGRKEVGVPLRVVLQPPVDELVVVVAFWAFANAKKEESSVEAWRKLVRGMLIQMAADHFKKVVKVVQAGKDAWFFHNITMGTIIKIYFLFLRQARRNMLIYS
jgi:hypothetical protein